MRGKTSWFVVAAMLVAVLAFQPASAEAQDFPERWSIVWVDFFGSLIECTDIGRCNAATGCPAYAFFADRFGRCEYNSEEFALGRYQLTGCTWKNIDWSFFAPNTREVIMDLSCSRWGGPFFWFGAVPPASCGAGVTYKRLDQYGANLTFNEGYTGATIGGRRDCASVFGPLTADELQEFDVKRIARDRWFR